MNDYPNWGPVPDKTQQVWLLKITQPTVDEKNPAGNRGVSVV